MSRNGTAETGARSAAAPDIELHIEELVLEGFSPAERHRVADALESELRRRLAGAEFAAASPGAGASIAALDAGTLALPRGASAGRIGAQTARAVFRALRAATSPASASAAPAASAAEQRQTRVAISPPPRS